MKTLTASDRKSLIRLAASLPKGDKSRRAILAGLKRSSDSEFEKSVDGKKFTHPETKNKVLFKSLPPAEQKKIREKFDKGDKGNKSQVDTKKIERKMRDYVEAEFSEYWAGSSGDEFKSFSDDVAENLEDDLRSDVESGKISPEEANAAWKSGLDRIMSEAESAYDKELEHADMDDDEDHAKEAEKAWDSMGDWKSEKMKVTF